jgi:hypothetical protein
MAEVGEEEKDRLKTAAVRDMDALLPTLSALPGTRAMKKRTRFFPDGDYYKEVEEDRCDATERLQSMVEQYFELSTKTTEYQKEGTIQPLGFEQVRFVRKIHDTCGPTHIYYFYNESKRFLEQSFHYSKETMAYEVECHPNT